MFALLAEFILVLRKGKHHSKENPIENVTTLVTA
jgi:hypothetical protein